MRTQPMPLPATETYPACTQDFACAWGLCVGCEASAENQLMWCVLYLVLWSQAFLGIEGFLSDGPQCYSCSGISNPRDCSSMTQCQFDEACYASRTVYTSSLSETYNLGCEKMTDGVSSHSRYTPSVGPFTGGQFLMDLTNPTHNPYALTCERGGMNIVGRKRNVRMAYHNVTSRDLTSCSRCCGSNGCNRDICTASGNQGQALPSSQDVYVRLIGGPNAFEGTVEVYYNGEWGSICDDNWSSNDARVVCKMLGYTSTGAGAMPGGLYPSSSPTRRIWLDEVRCTGTESSLAQCQKSPWGSNDCSHLEDAAVLCESVTVQDNIIYLLDTGIGGVLVRMNLMTQSFVPIPINHVYHPVTFDYDPEYGRLYFADGVLDQIVSIHYSGEDAKIIKQLDTNAEIQKLEVDPLNRMLFYSDDGNNVIAAMNLDGSNFRQIVTSNLDRPREVVVDPRSRKVYWSDWGSSPKIEMANYDGSSRQTLVSSGIQWPNGMAIDYSANHLYFVDGGLHNIEVMDLIGGNRRVIFHDPASHFFSLDVFGQYIYYTDWNHYTVMRINKDGTMQTNVGPTSFRQLSDIRVHKYGTDLPGVTTASPIHFDPAHVFVRVHGPATVGYVEVYANGQWGTICDDNWDSRDASVICRMVGLSPTGARAITNSQAGHSNHDLILLDEVNCQGGEQHIVDCGITQNNWGKHDCSHAEDAGVLCTMDNRGDNFLLFTSGGLLNRMSMSTYSYTVIPIPKTDPNADPNPIATVYDSSNHRVYFTEVKLNPGSQIFSADLDGNNAVLIKQLPQNSVADGLEVDTTNNMLFYTDTGRDVIASMDLNGGNERIIVSSGLDEPRAIIADPRNRVIYWTDWGSTPKIEKANYDGTNRQTLVSTSLRLPNGLELDRNDGVLYFCDAGTHVIESVTTSGGNRQVLFKDNSAHFFDLFLTAEYIYYTDWNTNGVQRINRDGSDEMMVGPPSFSRISGITGYRSTN